MINFNLPWNHHQTVGNFWLFQWDWELVNWLKFSKQNLKVRSIIQWQFQNFFLKKSCRKSIVEGKTQKDLSKTFLWAISGHQTGKKKRNFRWSFASSKHFLKFNTQVVLVGQFCTQRIYHVFKRGLCSDPLRSLKFIAVDKYL